MNTTFEMNNARKDADFLANGQLRKTSPVVEVFSAMVNGNDLSQFGAKADKAVNYIKELGSRACNGDYTAIAELNTMRRFVIETPVMEEMKLLGIFGSYQNVGFDETIEREITTHTGERSRVQANGGDVVFPAISVERYPVSTFTVSGGYKVDYRRVMLGDMSKENEGLNQVKIDIRNRCLMEIVNRVYKALKAATGVKYMFENSGLVKADVDDLLTKIRRFGKPTVIADYAVLSQFNDWAGYVGDINSNTITGITQKAMEDIAATGTIHSYRGAILAEMPNQYDFYKPTVTGADGSENFQTLLPAGLGFVIPAGAQSPIATYTRGGLTSLTGNDIKTGYQMTRFDIEVGVDVAKGQEYKVGTLYDTSLSGLEV